MTNSNSMSPPIAAYYSPPVPSADAEHLRLLYIFHYVLAGLTAFSGCIPIIHLVIGIAFLADAFPPDSSGQPPPRLIGIIFVGVAAVLITFFWALAIIMFFAGRNLTRRRHHTFCFVVACIECLNMPLGTALGIFTILVLMRPGVKAMFGLSIPGGPPPLAAPA